MLKRGVGIIVSVILIMSIMLSVTAEGRTEGFTVDERTHTLLRYEGNAEVAEIPDGTLFIGERAFEGSSVWQVVMPDSVIGIADRAFAACEELKQINLSANLLSIGDYTFYDCYSLESLELPEGLVYIGSYAFSWYAGIDGTVPGYSVIRIPASVVHISPRQASFSGWVTLDDAPRFEVDPANRFYRVENGMLIGHDGVLIQYRDPETGDPFRIVSVPEDVTAIAPCAFYGSRVLSIKLPESMRRIGQAAFAACWYLMELTIDCEKTFMEEGIVYACGPAVGYSQETPKAVLREWMSEQGEQTGEGPSLAIDALLAQLPDRPTLTLLNVDGWYTPKGPDAESLPWYIASFNGEARLDMVIDCGPYWSEVYREKVENDGEEYYYGLSFTETE